MCELPGVFTATKKNGTIYYRSSITFRNKHISLGSFETKDLAHNCYRLAKEIVTSSLGVMDYKSSYPISFDKWVILVNFRDNHYYFKNPIYMFKKYFIYYLSLEEELYFDIEDLFYYSSHKIHKRNGYYFVNDFGMQINILSRYKIKNHAVLNRDYKFIDGNDHNFRYDNIEVINPYYGVIKEETLQTLSYKAVININGTYIIGRYDDVITAAIAYNKSVDFLKNYHISDKSYPLNYIEGMTKEAYVKRYKQTPISKKILALFNKASMD